MRNIVLGDDQPVWYNGRFREYGIPDRHSSPGPSPEPSRTGITTSPGAAWRPEQCSFDTFLDDSRTTSGILALPLPTGVRVALTILKKLYAQKGSGRKEQALYRGLDPSRHEFVRRVLEVLGREPLLVRGKIGNQVMWWPIPTARARVSAILEAPLTSRDPVFDDLARL